MSRIAAWSEVEPGMFVHDNVQTYRVEALGKERVRLTDKDGNITTPLYDPDADIKIVYEVSFQQAVATIERVLGGTEI